MAFAADQVRPTTQQSPRTGSIIRFVWHHQGGVNDDATIGMMVSGSKNLSATFTVSNDNPGGRGWSRITQVVPDEMRPWTSSSPTADGRALTAEVANSTGGPEWGIAGPTHEACARLAAYAYLVGVPLQRANAGNGWAGHMGHNEVVGAFNEGYSTECPGNLNINWIIARAQQLVGDPDAPIGGALSHDEDDMFTDQDREQLRQANENAYQARVVAGDAREQTDPTRLNAAVSYVLTLLGVPQGVAELLGRPPAAGGAADPKAVAAEFAALVGDDLAQDVIDALAARLAGEAA